MHVGNLYKPLATSGHPAQAHGSAAAVSSALNRPLIAPADRVWLAD